jgi:DNA topoisomerase-1
MVSAANPLPDRRRGLVWWSDTEPAIQRVRSGRGFRYVGPDGRPVATERVEQIRRLAIPPAWADVRICPTPDGYLQATGRDARGRKQYRYHPAWRTAREDAKFHDLLAFGEALPAIRERVEADLRRPGMPREKVLALVVRLLDVTQARVGNEEYARDNHSFGLTTLVNRHALVEGSHVRLRFRGKAGRFHELGIRDRRLATLVRRSRELPGRQLFEYVDDEGEVRSVRSEDVNGYLRDASGRDVTAKTFRTWAATVLACRLLAQADAPTPPTRLTRRALREAVEVVADRLGNTPSVAGSAYIHPAVPEAFEHGALRRRVKPTAPEPGRAWTDADEAWTLRLLRRWTAEQAGRRMQRHVSSR